MNDTDFEARIVRLILSGESEKALEALSRHYGVETPKFRVGSVKGRVRNPAVYVVRTKTIHVSDAEGVVEPSAHSPRALPSPSIVGRSSKPDAVLQLP